MELAIFIMILFCCAILPCIASDVTRILKEVEKIERESKEYLYLMNKLVDCLGEFAGTKEEGEKE